MSDASGPDVEEVLQDRTPAEKLVYKVLEDADRRTQQEIADETRLSKVTVRKSLYQLEDAGLVASEHQYRDVRKKVYNAVKW